MKKLVTAFALCAAMSAMAVDSQNIVGYNSLTMGSGKFISLAFNFEKVGAAGSGILISDLTASPAFQLNDQIMVPSYTGSTFTYANYYYRDAAYLAFYEIEGNPGWYNLNDAPVGAQELPVGSAVWFQSQADKTVSVSGQVAMTSTTVFNTFPANKYTMGGSAYPVGFEPNKSGTIWTGITAGDQLMVPSYNGSTFTYVNYVYRDAAFLAFYEIEGNPGWYDLNDSYAGVIANVGFGFWILPQNQLTLTQPSPIAL